MSKHLSQNPPEQKEAYAVVHNSDRTEGRGHTVIAYVCEEYETALRLSKGIDVQGTDGKVEKVTVIRDDGLRCGSYNFWYMPGTLMLPSKKDLEAKKERLNQEYQEKKKQETIEKAKALGLGDEDIEILKQ